MLPRMILMLTFAATMAWIGPLAPNRAVARSPTPKLMAKLLASPKELVRLKAVAALQAAPRLKYDQLDTIIEGIATQLDRIGDDQTPTPSTVALMYMVGSTRRDSAVDFLSECLSRENPEILILAVDVLGESESPQAVESIGKMIENPSYENFYALRSGVVRALWSIGGEEALQTLATIHRQIDGQLRADIEEMFSSVTAGDFEDEDAFSRWQKRWDTDSTSPPADDETLPAASKTDSDNTNKDSTNQTPTLKIGSISDGGTEQRPKIKFQAPEYYGIPIVSKRTLFILDHSGSMLKETGAHGETRLFRAKQELIYAIQSLPPDHEFAIMIFSNEVRFWRRELEIAEPKNKAEAIRFVRGIGIGNRTNTYGALALSIIFDPSLEAVYMLTDGRPTLGSIVQTDLIVNDIMHRNRFRHLRFHTIGIAVEGETKTFLERLAKGSLAEFRQVN